MKQTGELELEKSQDFPEYDYKKVSELLFRVVSELFRVDLLFIDIMDDNVPPKQIAENISLIMKRSSDYLGIKVICKAEDIKDFIYKILDFQKVNKVVN